MSTERTIPGTRDYLGYQQLTGMTAAATLTVPDKAKTARLQAEAQNVRLRADGTAPTGTVGMLLIAGQPAVEFQGDLSAVQVIEATTGAILNVEYYA
jgi:hypothetical protein